MASKFGFLSRLEFLQDLASALIAGINPAVVHNLEKYHALKKVHYLSSIEDVGGDYLEFGVFTGSSFCHSIRCCRRMSKLNPKVLGTRFFGFDSFSGFGTLSEDDKHAFYTDENFETSLLQVNKRVAKVAVGIGFNLGSSDFRVGHMPMSESSFASLSHRERDRGEGKEAQDPCFFPHPDPSPGGRGAVVHRRTHTKVGRTSI